MAVIGQLADPALAGMNESSGQWEFTSRDGDGKGEYLIFQPDVVEADKSVPLVIFLHGAGHRGYDLTKLDRSWLPAAIRGGKMLDALVLCPQVDSYWSGRQASEFIQQALVNHEGQFDPDRVYLIGESSGGGGAWEGAKLEATSLAAVVPIATTLGSADGAEHLTELPIWAFHNINDPYQDVEKSRAQVEAVRELSGDYVFLTAYDDTPGRQHQGIWPNAHRHAWETALSDPALWEWLFHQRRGEPERALTPPPAPTLGSIVSEAAE